MDEKALLIQKLDDARAAMQALIDEIDHEMELYPGWTIKHVLAHIAGWDDMMVELLEAHTKGEEHTTMMFRSIDEYNANSVETRQGLNYRQVHAEWQQVRDKVKALIQALPAEKLAGQLLFPWGQRGTVADAVAIFAPHEIEHVQELRVIWEQKNKKE
jgi:hypothetical protein